MPTVYMNLKGICRVSIATENPSCKEGFAKFYGD